VSALLPHSFALDVAARRLSLDPRDPTFLQDPYPAYAAIQAVASMVYWEQLGQWCVFRYEDVDQLLRDRRFGREILHLTTRDALGWPDPPAHTRDFDAVDAHSLLEREPPTHTRLRSLINRAFGPRRVAQLRPAIEALAHALIDDFPSTPFDLIEAYATPIPVRIIARLLGVSEAMAPALLAWSHRMVAMYGVGRTQAVEEDANAAAAEFSAWLRDLVAERRHAPGDDLLSLLIAAEDGGARLSEPELVSTAILLLNAGHEATVHALGNAVHAALTQCDAAERMDLVRDEGQVARFVEEALRYRPPLHLFKRYVLEPLSWDGVDLPQGAQIAVLLGAAGRDPRVNVDPHRFDPTRLRPAHVSFGAGIHYCVGAPLARLELQVALQTLFQRCPTLALADVPRVQDSWHFHGLERLLVTRG